MANNANFAKSIKLFNFRDLFLLFGGVSDMLLVFYKPSMQVVIVERGGV